MSGMPLIRLSGMEPAGDLPYVFLGQPVEWGGWRAVYLEGISEDTQKGDTDGIGWRYR